MKPKKKLLIAGLLGANGGRELEAAFIAKSLAKTYDIAMLSTVNVHEDSDLFTFNFDGKVDGLNQLVYKNNLLVRFTTTIMYAFRKKIRPNHFHISNKLTRVFVNLKQAKTKVLERHISQFDAVLICAQLHSQMIPQLVNSAEKLTIPTIFRTTGTIDLPAVSNKQWLEKVTHFVHHSSENANRLSTLATHNHTLIDQCAFEEEALLKIPVNTSKITRFFCLGRLDANKNIATVIDAFKMLAGNDFQLTIIGEGEKKKFLQELAKSDRRIIFKNAVPHHQIAPLYATHQCLIIASKSESGPLTGIEALAAGRLIVSTKVGAMPERLTEHPFWYDGTSEGLKAALIKATLYEPDDIKRMTTNGRELYNSRFSKEEIKKQYMAVLASIV